MVIDIPVHIVSVAILGVAVGRVVIMRILIFAPPVVSLVHQSVPFVLTVIFMVLQQTCHSLDGFYPVSYTHLDVYKRQSLLC